MGLSITGNVTGFSGGTVAAAVVIDDDSAAALAVGPNGNTNPAFRVVGSVASAATGLSVTGNAAGAGVTLTALSSGSNEDIILSPKGSGKVSSTANNITLTGTSNFTTTTGTAVIGSGAIPGSLSGFWTTDTGTGYLKAQNVNYQITWNNDVGIGRSAAGVFKITDGSTGAGGLSSPARTPAQIAADQNDYSPGVGMYQRWSSDAARNVTGMVAGADGAIRYIWNVGSQNIVLQHENASSTAANRFLASTGADLTLGANKVAFAQYDTTSARWRVTLLP